MRAADNFSLHLRRSRWVFFSLAIVFLMGVALGICAICSDTSFTKILNPSDKLMFEFIAGTAPTVSIFFDKLLEFGLLFLAIFVLNLSVYSGVLSFAVFGFQAFLLVITSSVIISLYGFVGILNVIFFVVPINVCFLMVCGLFISFAWARAKDAKRFNLSFGESFKFSNLPLGSLACIFLAVAICAVHSFVIPLLIKSFLIFAY